MVADSYKDCPIISEIFAEGGKKYVQVQTGINRAKKVRWYTKKGEKMPEIAKTSAFNLEPETPMLNAKKILGFGDKGYITIFKGDTEATRDWFARNGRYAKPFGWYFPADTNYTTLPINIEPIKIYWNDVSKNDILLPENQIKDILDEKKYGISASQYAGNIGEKIKANLTVIYEKDIKTDYGTSYFHVMEDNKGNKYTWTTNTKKLNAGSEYIINATIKDLRKYKGENQTVLSYCKVINCGEN